MVCLIENCIKFDYGVACRISKKKKISKKNFSKFDRKRQTKKKPCEKSERISKQWNCLCLPAEVDLDLSKYNLRSVVCAVYVL